MATFIPALEIIYRELARPKTKQPTQTPTRATPRLSREDVSAILARQRQGTPAELEHIFANANEFHLTPSEKSQLSVDLTIAMANARQSHGRPEHPSDRFIAQVLGLLDTPYGLVERSFVDDLFRGGSQSITRCRLHRPPLCSCWASQRAILYQAMANGEKTPEGWAAKRICSALEELEAATRPERQSISAAESVYRDGYRDEMDND
jgi:hypothetical protein